MAQKLDREARMTLHRLAELHAWCANTAIRAVCAPSKGHRIAVGAKVHQPVPGTIRLTFASLRKLGWLTERGQQVRPFLVKAHQRRFMGGAVHPGIRNGGVPLFELVIRPSQPPKPSP